MQQIINTGNEFLYKVSPQSNQPPSISRLGGGAEQFWAEAMDCKAWWLKLLWILDYYTARNFSPHFELWNQKTERQIPCLSVWQINFLLVGVCHLPPRT
jgi:hypothetical protein